MRNNFKIALNLSHQTESLEINHQRNPIDLSDPRSHPRDPYKSAQSAIPTAKSF